MIVEETKRNGPGRPKKYGEKVKLIDIFTRCLDDFVTIQSPVYGDQNVMIKYYTMDLVWKGLGEVVRFIWVIHPKRGSIILLSTDLNLCPIEAIKMYAFRFKIEVSFKMMNEQIGTFAYHFWMKFMDKIKRRSKGQFLHKKEKKYREKVLKKMNTYHLHMQIAFIAQGLLQYLSIAKTELVWGSFNGFIRTIRKYTLPSERIVSMALRESFVEFLLGTDIDENLRKFILLKHRFLPNREARDGTELEHDLAC